MVKDAKTFKALIKVVSSIYNRKNNLKLWEAINCIIYIKLSNLQNSTLETLSFWLLVIYVYWKKNFPNFKTFFPFGCQNNTNRPTKQTSLTWLGAWHTNSNPSATSVIFPRDHLARFGENKYPVMICSEAKNFFVILLIHFLLVWKKLFSNYFVSVLKVIGL